MHAEETIIKHFPSFLPSTWNSIVQTDGILALSRKTCYAVRILDKIICSVL